MADGAKLSVDKIRTAIADILETKELESLTSRMVRNTLEQRFSVGLKDRKKEIDELLMSMIQEREEKKKQEEKEKEDEKPTNGTADSESEEDELEDEPPVKKVKKNKTKKEQNAEDAEVARKLQGREKGLRTRKQPVKRTPKTTTKKPGEKGKSGFSKMMVLSPDLAKIVGADEMSRSDVVKKMWQVIKERDLRDPKDRRFHICDDELLKVFGKKRVQTFSMMKYLKQHVKDPALIT